jgi:hypothetical protein
MLKKLKINQRKSAKGKNQGNMWRHVEDKKSLKRLCGIKWMILIG